MDLSEYQHRAKQTDRIPGTPDAPMVALLGLAGEVGSLLTEFKKKLRDGEAHPVIDSRIDEELGDILWYLAATATATGRRLNDIAEANLAKTAARWGDPPEAPTFFDDEVPEHERLPRSFTGTFVAADDQTCRLFIDDRPAGEPLRDNARPADEYRWHDVLHLAFATHLGWSPVFRGILSPVKRKRRSDPDVDEIEDGGRAIVIDEAVVALAFADAREHRMYERADRVDSDLLRTISGLTAHLEVARRTSGDWQRAILDGFRIWRLLIAHNGGTVNCDLRSKTMTWSRQ